jgi:hypothetical protein
VDSQFKRYALLAAIVIPALTYFRIRIRPAYKQDRKEVFFRAPGDRYLKD